MVQYHIILTYLFSANVTHPTKKRIISQYLVELWENGRTYMETTSKDMC